MPVRSRRYNAVLACAATLRLASLPGEASERIQVSLRSNAIQLDTSSVKAGMVTFEVIHETDNHLKHEMVVLVALQQGRTLLTGDACCVDRSPQIRSCACQGGEATSARGSMTRSVACPWRFFSG